MQVKELDNLWPWLGSYNKGAMIPNQHWTKYYRLHKRAIWSLRQLEDKATGSIHIGDMIFYEHVKNKKGIL